MLYRPDYLLKESKRQSARAWQVYSDCLEFDCCHRKELAAREQYIEAHNKVAAVSREIRKRDRSHKKPIQ